MKILLKKTAFASALFAMASLAHANTPDLTIDKSHVGNFVRGQTTAQYNIVVRNIGLVQTTNKIVVTDNVPVGLIPEKAEANGWSCDVNGQQVRCETSDNLAPNTAFNPIQIIVAVARTAPASLVNTAQVSMVGERNVSNNIDRDPTTIISRDPDLTIDKSHVGNFVRGGQGDYRIVVRNIGLVATNNAKVTVTDTVPIGLKPTKAEASNGWSCNINNQQVSCETGDNIAPNVAMAPIVISVDVARTAPASLTNTARVATPFDSNLANNVDSDPTSIISRDPDLVIDKSHVGDFRRGTEGRYQMVVRNIGVVPTNNATVVVTDNVPVGLVPEKAEANGWSCNINGQQVRCETGDNIAPNVALNPIVLLVKVAPTAPASVTNTARVAIQYDANPNNNTDSDLTRILP